MRRHTPCTTHTVRTTATTRHASLMRNVVVRHHSSSLPIVHRHHHPTRTAAVTPARVSSHATGDHPYRSNRVVIILRTVTVSRHHHP
jgi:hypothetical protein